MYILDSDTLTHLHAGNARVIRRLTAVEDADVCISIVTRIEVLRGRFDGVLKAATGDDLLRAQLRLQQTEALLGKILVVRFDSIAAAEFDRLNNLRKLRSIGRNDLLIASISLANGATLVTRNLRHFERIPELQLANWVD